MDTKMSLKIKMDTKMSLKIKMVIKISLKRFHFIERGFGIHVKMTDSDNAQAWTVKNFAQKSPTVFDRFW